MAKLVSSPITSSIPSLPHTVTRKRKRRKDIWKAYLFILPIIPFILVFDYFPFLRTFIYSLSSVNAQGKIIRFVGLDNYINLFGRQDFINALLVTLKFTAMYVPLAIICPLLLALIAAPKSLFAKTNQLLYSIPMGVSMAVTCLIFEQFYAHSGLLNYLLNLLGLMQNTTDIKWLHDQTWALPSLVIPMVWTHIGFDFLLMLAAVRNVPQDLLESSEMDGASYWTKTFRITLPLISPTLFFVVCTQIIVGLTMVAPVMILTKGGPLGATSTLIYYIYTSGFRSVNYSLASTASICAFILTFIFLLINFLYEKKGVVYE
ncbi:sugar ABC transporter permease [Paenibacillus qinlingensis]|uniref:Sn-glycerol 3-phosphate transport system permease protein n=1 Tax=Paenibacillus qinlingensis TaxID=1837343 RepID=A0ABU1P337_9BACL|nr:sugar ABC transporter permease [Paenibacillus qinlingensis]MDR6554161.1 sn-glycerol 3-phosphate transport system permease protein [Paenibacillus qinlingensis]